MKKIQLLALGMLCIATSCKNTNETPEATEEVAMEETTEQPTETWEVLFDGSNFDHWRGYNMETMPPQWTIEENAMVFTPGEEHGNNIITKKQYTNFLLSLEWKISEGGNSGIFYGIHEDTRYGEPYQTGPEIQVLDDAKHPDAKVGNGTHTAGSLYDMIAPSEKVVKPAGEWNLCIIEVNHKANKGMVSLNGTIIVEFPVNGPQWDAMVENSKFKGWEGFGAFKTGHIGLQDHGDKVWYRHVKIKPLD